MSYGSAEEASHKLLFIWKINTLVSIFEEYSTMLHNSKFSLSFFHCYFESKIPCQLLCAKKKVVLSVTLDILMVKSGLSLRQARELSAEGILDVCSNFTTRPPACRTVGDFLLFCRKIVRVWVAVKSGLSFSLHSLWT